MATKISPKNTFHITERLVREDERRFITSISRAHCYQLEKRGLFPTRIRLGQRSCAWRLSELLAWIEAR
ncbi:helix-turn-helix transcriptional regulator [Photobacterium damselae]|uniref:AlpA family phage regulatory protein n=1 Tax=Photobacterium damselae TaxID=38293 RepID=A0ABD6WZY7_PHODM|nr:AlpA family phage regulatory protein [Photobacterium damselae]OBU38736.1 transcriptional regulator [Photobacterium damselae]PSU15257.1 AlpA family phage regulatory protein [Photobacterium damselae]